MQISLTLRHFLPCFSVLFLFSQLSKCQTEIGDQQSHKIEGKVVVSVATDQEWIANTRVVVDGGAHLAFLRSDGTFTINNLPTGSYVIEVLNPDIYFDPARVDINSKGKLRARKVNNIQPTAVSQMTYPIKFKARGRPNYFQPREQWRVTDILMNPMIMMMVLPFIMIMVLPKLINTADPETQKEMQSQMNMFNPSKNSMPDLSEMVTSWLGGGNTKKPNAKSKAVKRKP